MNKSYLKKEIIEGLEAVEPFPETLKTTFETSSVLEIIEEVEMELEHVISCIISLKCELEREY